MISLTTYQPQKARLIMALNEAQQLSKLLENSRHILIVFGPKHDLDTICGALAWKIFLEKQHKQADIVSENYSAGKNLRFLKGAEAIKPQLAHLQKFIIKVDVSRAKIDTLSYDIKDNWLSIYLTPKEGTVTKNDLRTAESSFKYDAIITINTPDMDSLGNIFANNTDLFYRLPIINFDSNPNNEHYGQINIIELTSVSTSENIFKIMNIVNPSLIDEEIATALLAGIISKTQSFKTANITPNTLNTASQLMKLGADREKIIRHLYHNRSISSLKIWGQALSHLKNDANSGLVWSILTRDDFIRSGATEEDLNELIDELIVNSLEAKVIVLLYEDANATNQICGLIRSNEERDAKELIARFNPQGNKKRASFTIKDKKLLEAETDVIEEIKKKI